MSRTSTSDNLLTPPVHANNPSDAGASTSRHPVMQAREPQMPINRSDAGLPNPRPVPLEEPQIQNYNTGSPLSSSPKRGHTREELRKKIDKYTSRIRELAAQERGKAKGKGKAPPYPNKGRQARQKKVSRLHRRILEQMLNIMQRCNARGFVYGLVAESSKPVNGTSDSLRAWWQEEITFDKVGPGETEKYYIENSVSSLVPRDNEAKPTSELLMELSDPTLGSILSVLMQNCDPPQIKFPFQKGLPPPWWPTASEDWWGQTGIPSDEGPPPYKKPHDLRKKWKVAVLIAIIKYMSPDFSRPYSLAQMSRHLQGRMNAKEAKFWNLALIAEAKRYCQEHRDMPLDEVVAFLREHGGNDPHIGRNINAQTSRNRAIRSDNPVGVAAPWPPFYPPSTVAPTGQPQLGGVQVSRNNAPNPQMAMSGWFARENLHWAYSYNPGFSAYGPLGMQQNRDIRGLGASSGAFQDPRAHAIEYPLFFAQQGGASTVSTQDLQNQMHGGNFEFGTGPSSGNRNGANEG